MLTETACIIRINRPHKQIQMLHITAALLIILYCVGHQHFLKHRLHLGVQRDFNLQKDFINVPPINKHNNKAGNYTK